MSSARLRTDRLKLAKAGDVSTPDGSCTAGSPWRSRRVVSGTVGDSILTTSAPSSARAVPHSAPAMTMPKEITLIRTAGAVGPVRGRGADRHSPAIAAGSCSPSRGAGRRYCASSGCPDTNGWPGTSNSPRAASGARTKKPRLRGCGSWVNCPMVLTSAHGTLSCWPRATKSSRSWPRWPGRPKAMISSARCRLSAVSAQAGSLSSGGLPRSRTKPAQCLSVRAMNWIRPSRQGQTPPTPG